MIDSKNQFLILLVSSLLVLLNTNECFANIKAKEKDIVFPICSVVGEIGCPKGYKPSCPKQYKPSCIFVTNKHLPACLADNTDTTFYSYRLDKISCEKK